MGVPLAPVAVGPSMNRPIVTEEAVLVLPHWDLYSDLVHIRLSEWDDRLVSRFLHDDFLNGEWPN